MKYYKTCTVDSHQSIKLYYTFRKLIMVKLLLKIFERKKMLK